jgi:hypothetical protein
VLGYPPVALSAQEKKDVEEMAKQVAEHLNNGYGGDIQALTDWNVIIQRVANGIQGGVLDKNEIRDKINKEWATDSDGLFRNVLLDQKRDAQKVDAAFVAHSERDGYATVKLRIAPKAYPNRVEYHEALIYPLKQDDGSKKLKIIDSYDAQQALWVSDRLRWAAIQESGVKSEDNGMWLRTFGEDAKPHLLELKTLISQDVLRNGGAAYKTISAFPKEMRANPDVWAMEFAACRNALDDTKKAAPDDLKPRFLELLANPPPTGRNKPEVDTVLAEMLMLDGKQEEAEALLQKVFDKNKDGWLKLMVSKWRFAKGDVTGAETAFQQAKAASPGIKGLFDHGKAIESKKANP